MADKKYQDPEVCDACGVSGQMGYIIAEDDVTSTVKIKAVNGEAIKARFQKYLDVAKNVATEFTYETTPINADTTEMTAQIKFDVSAEKIIFELQTRSLNS